MSISGCCIIFFFSSRRRHTRCALVTGVQTCALPFFRAAGARRARLDLSRVTRPDTSGAWLFDRVVRRLSAEGIRIDVAGAAPDHAPPLRLVDNDWPGSAKGQTPSPIAFPGLLYRFVPGFVPATTQAKPGRASA